MSFVGLLAAGIALTISTCLNVWRRSVEAAELNQEARAIVELLSRDVSGTYLGLERNAGYLVGIPAEEGQRAVDALVMCTESSSLTRAALLPEELRSTWDLATHPPVTDYVAVAYRWLDGSAGVPGGLYRTTQVVPRGYLPMEELPVTGEMTPELISDAVVGLTFSYFDGRQWTGSWATTEEDTRLPSAVAIELVLRDAREKDHVYQTIVPIRAR
ncbi:MAG: type II secretion system protein GspJ [Armatimonadetes bacterium]|nr:type II secretion system protein GspJ [Armatimonadota bacterium]